VAALMRVYLVSTPAMARAAFGRRVIAEGGSGQRSVVSGQEWRA